MSYDDLEKDLLVAFQNRFAVSDDAENVSSDTGVLRGAEHVYDNATDVHIDMQGTQAAAEAIWLAMQKKNFSTKNWSMHDLHPKAKDESTIDFIFTMDLLNFSFWSDGTSGISYAVDYRGKTWTGYWSMVAALQRALDEGIAITSSDFWQNEHECTEDILKYVFRSATDEPIPLLTERIMCLREAGRILYKTFECRFATCIKLAEKSAVKLVNLLADNFPCFRDEVYFEDEKVRFLKKAQILVADLWGCFNGQDFGEFHDIDRITIFPDYRIPQALHSLRCLSYSPPLDSCIRQRRLIDSGHSWEVQLRGCAIWTIELMVREINRMHPEAGINSILIDFFLYDTLKEHEREFEDQLTHHRTRSIWY